MRSAMTIAVDASGSDRIVAGRGTDFAKQEQEFRLVRAGINPFPSGAVRLEFWSSDEGVLSIAANLNPETAVKISPKKQKEN